MEKQFVATNVAFSVGVSDHKQQKALCRRSDRSGILYLVKWIDALTKNLT